MGRSSRSQAGENRSRIIERASALFREKGVEAVGISEVMKAAGMTQGGFYKHFASKDALAAEACTFAFSKADEGWRRIAEAASKDGRSRVKAVMSYYVEPKPPEMTCPMLAFASDVATRGREDPLYQAYGSGVRRLLETFAEFASGEEQDASDGEPRALFAAMVGANMLARSSRDASWAEFWRRSEPPPDGPAPKVSRR